MAKSTGNVKIDPQDITISPAGKVTITNKKLAAQLKRTLAGKDGIMLKPGGSSAFLDVNFGC